MVTQAARKVRTPAVKVKALAVSEGSGGEGEGSSSEGEPGDGDSQQGESSGEVVEVSCHEAEESGSESSSSSSESKVEAKKAHPSRKTVETDPNTTLPELDNKDSEEEQKMRCHGFACCMDADFGTWRHRKISQGLKQWDERDKMTCDHVEPGKKWGSVGTSKSSPLPTSLPPATMCMAFWRKPGSFPGQTYLWCTHRMWSQWFACFKNSTPMPAFDTIRWRLMSRQVAKLRGSCCSAHSVNTQAVMTPHTSIISSVCWCGKCLTEVFPTGQWLTVHKKHCKGLKMEAAKEKPATSHTKVAASSSSDSKKKKKHKTKSHQPDLQLDSQTLLQLAVKQAHA